MLSPGHRPLHTTQSDLKPRPGCQDLVTQRQGGARKGTKPLCQALAGRASGSRGWKDTWGTGSRRQELRGRARPNLQEEDTGLQEERNRWTLEGFPPQKIQLLQSMFTFSTYDAKHNSKLQC